MKLSEILHTVAEEKKSNLINVDDWKFADADHLKTMGFEFDGDYVMSLKDPTIKIYKKKMPQGECFVIEEDGKGVRIFQEFEQVIDYFDHYPQPEIDKERS